MKRIIYQVAVGPLNPLYEFCLDSVTQYCKRHGITHLVQREPKLKIRPKNSQRSENAVEKLGYLPIYEKENAFAYLTGYDQVAIIDADVYVTHGAACIFEDVDSSVPFAGVIEENMPLTEAYAKKVKAYARAQYGPLEAEIGADKRFFNMGVMVLGQGLLEHLNGETPRQFLERPEFQRFIDGEGAWRWSTDQTLLNYWVRSSGMETQYLDWTFNALFKGVKDVDLSDAQFIHFFLSSKLPRGGAGVPEIVRRIEDGMSFFPDCEGHK